MENKYKGNSKTTNYKIMKTIKVKQKLNYYNCFSILYFKLTRPKVTPQCKCVTHAKVLKRAKKKTVKTCICDTYPFSYILV